MTTYLPRSAWTSTALGGAQLTGSDDLTAAELEAVQDAASGKDR